MMNLDLQRKEINLQMQLGGWLTKEEEETRPKSRENCIMLGDRNTKFFYNACKVRNHKNQIYHQINIEGLTVANEDKLKESATLFYEELFNTDSYNSIFPELIIKKKLTQKATQWLTRPVSDKEVKKAVFQFNVDEAPGVDGIIPIFVRRIGI